MTATIRCTVAALGFVALFAIGGVGSLAQPSRSASSAVDTFVVVVPVRPAEEIENDIKQATALRARAEARQKRAEEDARTIEAQIEARQKEIEALEQHADTLEAERHEADIAAATGKIALLEKLNGLLEIRKNLHEADGEAAAAVVDHASAQEELFEQERALAKTRKERAALAKQSGMQKELLELDRALKELEAEVLEAWERAIQKHENSVSADEGYVDRLKQLAEAQARYHTP